MIYLDNAATTKISDNVLSSMLPYLKENYGNASSLYSLGCDSKKAITKARCQVAKAINANANEIYFTSCGSESDNWALQGIAKKGDHIITSNVEHHAILNTCKYLESQGVEVTYLPVNSFGEIYPKDVENAIKNNTVLVSIMTANNEIGTIYPIKKIGAICKRYNVLFHTDAVQAIGNIPIDVNDMNIDLLSLSGHKFNAPKGIGALYIRKGIKINNLIYGGQQENKMRAGTENIASIVGLGTAIEDATRDIESKSLYISSLRDFLYFEIVKNIPDVKLNGLLERRLHNNLNISFNGIEAESMLLMLDMKGICVSAGSACNSNSIEPSYVLKAIGLNTNESIGSIRFSLCKDNTIQEIEYTTKVIIETVKKLKELY